jgi:hypothetical protein
VTPSSVPPSLAVVFQVIDILDELGVRYHLGGSFASAIYGVPRQTMDADLVVDLAAATATRLVERLRDDFYVDLDVAQDAVRHRSSFNAVHLSSGFKIDFFVKGDGEYDEVELERSVVTEVSKDPPRTARVKTAEDTVLRKLQWFRSGGEVSDRQWTDVLGVMATVGAGLDRGYLHTWATKLGVVDLLDRASAEVDGG